VIDPTVRRAVAADVGQLASLEGRARAALVDQRGGARWLATHAERGGAWPDTVASGIVLVAHIDDCIVGYLAATVDGEVIRIDEVYVQPEARELGFGDAMIEAATEAGMAGGCTLIEAEALPGDRDTKNLYERAGITARLIVVSRRLV
jgi:GNAT superfamily N-acetyltransferase